MTDERVVDSPPCDASARRLPTSANSSPNRKAEDEPDDPHQAVEMGTEVTLYMKDSGIKRNADDKGDESRGDPVSGSAINRITTYEGELCDEVSDSRNRLFKHFYDNHDEDGAEAGRRNRPDRSVVDGLRRPSQSQIKTPEGSRQCQNLISLYHHGNSTDRSRRLDVRAYAQ